MTEFEIWFPAMIVAFAILVAGTMNHSSGTIRQFSRSLQALGCFGLVYCFWILLELGIIDRPRDPTSPFDVLKPALLWIQAAFCLVAGCVLLVTTWWSKPSQRSEPLPLYNTNASFGSVTRFVHWTTAILFLALVPIGIATSMVPIEADFRGKFYMVHKTLGLVVVIFVVFRLIWHKFSPTPNPTPSLSRMVLRLSRVVHASLYMLLIVVPVTGFVFTTYEGYPTYFFWMEFPPLWPEDHLAAKRWGILHKYFLHAAIYGLITVHVAGAFKHIVFRRGANSIRRMIAS